MSESWKKKNSEFEMFVDRRTFVPPSVTSEKKEPTRFFAAVFGLFFLISFYTLSLFVILRLLGVDSLSYVKVAAITGLAVLVRYVDAAVTRSFGR